MIFRNDTDKDTTRGDEPGDGDGRVIDGDVVDGYDEDVRPEARDEDLTTADTVVTDPDNSLDVDNSTDLDNSTDVDDRADLDSTDLDSTDLDDSDRDDETVDATFDGPDAASTFDHAADDEDDDDDQDLSLDGDDDLSDPDDTDAESTAVVDAGSPEARAVDTDHDGTVYASEAADTDAEPVGYAAVPHGDLGTVDGSDRDLSAADVAEPGVGTPAFDTDDDVPATAEAVAVATPGAETPEAPVDTPADLVPGGVTTEPGPGGWSDEDGQAYRDRWRDVQLRFVDDPRGAAAEAGTLVGEAVDAFTAQLARQRQELDSWQSSEGDDTEIFRVAVRRYRDLLDKILAS
jgi:hypothetical protein